jgi:hypothetical protein
MKTDRELRKDVQDKRKWTPVNVVMLPGYVYSWADMKWAERAVKQVSGVKAVAEETGIGAFEMIKTKDGVVDVIENGKKCLGGSFLRESQALAFINDRIERQQRVESMIEHDCFHEHYLLKKVGRCGFSCDGSCARCCR